ncbi:ThuA domain-containing protein [Pontiella agarivorans]|uniref:ThuA domain-containing protein n=1 Tax=Pontiella agarivorans TaxID=3038953 RepID=A0ABU5N0Q1_9BACT|nr:ThuA domain-containing protein [Pontiella agarivorans]MDZ8120029.1 ThuA domain-containing protein [Pontiella agarivorans]
MKQNRIMVLMAVLCFPMFGGAVPLKALIIDGQNNHKVWPKSTIMMRQYLEETGLFEVDIARTKFLLNSTVEAEWLPLAGVAEGAETKGAKTDPDFKPDFKKYDVVISNFGYRAAPWPKETQTAFEAYMREGGGFVSVHAADNCFPEWKAYNQMIGVGGWAGRDETAGPYIYVNKLGEVVRDHSPGICGKHGKRSDFIVNTYNQEHPITKGLPEKWMHAYDECYAYMRGPAENLTILGTAESTLTHREEPMLMVIEYHEGRIFHTTLGHDTKGFECVGFITTFKRGVEWAATGTVTQTEIPPDFPGIGKISQRAFKLTTD